MINNQLQNNGRTDAATASLLDQRDQYIDQLSQLMDIRVVTNNLNQVTVFTNSGVQLVGTEAATAVVQSAGHDDAEHAVRYRIRPRAMSAPSPSIFRTAAATIWSSTNVDPVGQARRLSRTARQHAGAGAGADRPVRGVDVERAVGQDHRRRRGSCQRAAAGRLRSRSVGIADRQRHPHHLQGQHHRHHAQPFDRARRRSERAAAEQQRDRSIRTTRCSASISPAAWPRSSPSSTPRSAPAPTCSSPIRRASTLRVLDDGAPNRSDVIAASVTDTVSSLTSGSAAASAVHRRRHALYRRDHRQRLAANRPCRPHQRQHRAARRSLAHHRLFNQSAHRRGRHDALRFHPQPADRPAAYRYSPQTGIGTTGTPFTGTLLNFARQVHQPAGRGRELRQAARGRPGRRAQHPASRR